MGDEQKKARIITVMDNQSGMLVPLIWFSDKCPHCRNKIVDDYCKQCGYNFKTNTFEEVGCGNPIGYHNDSMCKEPNVTVPDICEQPYESQITCKTSLDSKQVESLFTSVTDKQVVSGCKVHHVNGLRICVDGKVIAIAKSVET